MNKQFSYFNGEINNLVKIAKNKDNTLVKYVLLQVSPSLVYDLSKAGIDIDEHYVHTIDNFSIAHSLKQHSHLQNEKLRGQIPLVDSDFEMIPKIIEKYDKIEFSKNKRNQNIIKYSKTFIDGTTYYVEEVRVGRKELSMLTMYKRKLTGEPMPKISSEVLTSVTDPDLPSGSKDTTNISNIQRNKK